jgi:hypothetical protein
LLKSATTNERNVGAAAAPVVGPASMRFADCVAHEIANVPVVVTGDPLTVNCAGVVNATEVTVPVPAHVPSPRQNVEDDAPVPLLKSATTSVLKVGAAGMPDVGPAKNVCAVCVFNVKLNDGVVVGFETEVVNSGERVPALKVVTVPEPPPDGT